MKDYIHGQGHPYEDETDRYGFISIEVLPVLKGKPWNEVALAYVSSLKPDRIRVVRHHQGQTMAAMTGRGTVQLGEDGRREENTEDALVWLPQKVAHGEAPRYALEYGIDSPQCQWHNDDKITGYFMDGINGGYYKTLEDGTSVPFPSPNFHSESHLSDTPLVDAVVGT